MQSHSHTQPQPQPETAIHEICHESHWVTQQQQLVIHIVTHIIAAAIVGIWDVFYLSDDIR